VNIIYRYKDIELAITTLKNRLVLGINKRKGSHNYLNEVRGIYEDIDKLLEDLDILNNEKIKIRFLYGIRCLLWRPIFKIKTKRHEIILRQLKDTCTGKRCNRYDILIDGVTSIDADSIEKLIIILNRDPSLKWIGRLLEENIPEVILIG